MDFAKKVLPYAKLAIQIIFVVRIILLLLALKWMKVTKVFLYFDQLTVIAEQLCPYNMSYNLRATLCLMTGIFNFTTEHFSFFPGMICTVL